MKWTISMASSRKYSEVRENTHIQTDRHTHTLYKHTHIRCIGYVFPSISMIGQPPKYSEKSVVSMVADMSTTRRSEYALSMSRNTTRTKSL